MPSAVVVFGVAIAASDYLPYALLAPLILGGIQYATSGTTGISSLRTDVRTRLIDGV